MNKKALSKLPSELSGQRTLVRDESSRGTPTTTDTTPQSALPPDKATPRAPSREDSDKKDNEKGLGQSSFNVPDGTAKEIKTRTVPAEGDEYGHPYQDGTAGIRTRVNQRTASPEWVADMYLGELDFEAEDIEAEDIEAARRWMGGIRPSKGRTRRRPRSVMNRSNRLRNRGGTSKRHKYRFNPKTRKTQRVKLTPKQILERKKYDRDYELRRRHKTPSGRKKQRGFYKPKTKRPTQTWKHRKKRTRPRRRRAFDMNLEAIQNVMAEMGLYEIRPPDTTELQYPSGTNYSPSGGNGYWKHDPANKERRPSEKQDTSREPSDAGNSSRVVPQGQYVKASIRVAYRFLRASRPIPIDQSVVDDLTDNLYKKTLKTLNSLVLKGKGDIPLSRISDSLASHSVSIVEMGATKPKKVIFFVDVGERGKRGQLFSSGNYETDLDEGSIEINPNYTVSQTWVIMNRQKKAALYKLRSIISHEITHAYEYQGNLPLDALGLPISIDTKGLPPKQYVNEPKEVRAFMRQIVDDVLIVYKKQPQALQKALESQPIDKVVANISKDYKAISPFLEPKNDSKILGAVYQTLYEKGLRLRRKFANRH